MKFKNCILLSLLFVFVPALNLLASGYAIVVQQAVQEDAAWSPVVAALQKKYPEAVVVTWQAELDEALPQLQVLHPRYTCFVQKPEQAGRAFVGAVHMLVRQYDADPYADTFWGIITGYTPEAALRIATHSEPLVVRKVASGTELAMDKIEEGTWYCELKARRMVSKEKGAAAEEAQGPQDTTKALVDTLNEYQADLFVTSGHATERDWQIGFRYHNGYFKCQEGVLYGIDTQDQRFDVQSPNPKVYLPIGNCLMGHIDGLDAMALAWMNSAGVNQMIGYTVPTWYGYAGWGMLDYFVEQPGRYTMAEAYRANQHALIHRLQTWFPDLIEVPFPASAEGRRRAEPVRPGLSPRDGAGLLFDRDVVAFYGDPAWEARMAAGPLHYSQELTREGDVWTLTIEPQQGAASFEPVNTNGSQRGGRPMVAHLPERVGAIEVLQGEAFEPVCADDFVLVPNPGKAQRIEIKFRAAPVSAAL